MFITVLAWLNVTVSDSNGSESFLCILVDDSLHLGNNVVIKGCNLTCFVYVGIAAGEDHLRGALNVQSLVVATVSGRVFNDGGHSLARRREGEANLGVVGVFNLVLLLDGFHVGARSLHEIRHTFVRGTELSGDIAANALLEKLPVDL